MTEAAITALGTVGAALIGAATTGGATAANLGMTSKARKENFEYNELAAANAAERQKAYTDYLQKLKYQQFYDLESPKAIIQQLRDAGLSPSIFANGAMGGGVSGVSVANAPQGAGTAGQGAIPITPINPVAFSDIANGFESIARAKLLEEDAKRLRGENEMGNAEITQILAEAGYKDAAKKTQETQNRINNIEFAIKNETYSEAIRTIKANAEQAEWQSEDAFWNAANKMQTFVFDAETFEDRANSIKNDVANTLADTALKYAKKQLTDEEKAKIVAETERIYNDMFYFKELHLDSATAYQNWLQTQTEKLPEQLKLFGQKLGIEKQKMWIEAGTSILHTAGNLVGVLSMVRGKGTKGTTSIWKNPYNLPTIPKIPNTLEEYQKMYPITH